MGMALERLDRPAFHPAVFKMNYSENPAKARIGAILNILHQRMALFQGRELHPPPGI